MEWYDDGLPVSTSGKASPYHRIDMGIAVKIITALLMLQLVFKPRKILYGDWNTRQDKYRDARSGLSFLYVMCIVGAIGVVIWHDDAWGFFFGHEDMKSLSITAPATVMSSLFVFTYLGIDANFRASRRLGYEKNRFKHWLFDGASVLPMAACLIVNKLLIVVAAVAVLVGWALGPFKPRTEA